MQRNRRGKLSRRSAKDKTAYIDTSVLIASVKPNDPDYTASKTVLRSGILKVTSYITLAEMTSSLSRLFVAGQIRIDPRVSKVLDSLSYDEKIRAIVLYILQKHSVRILSCLGLMPSGILNVDIPIEFLESIKLAPTIRLKTLDNLHVTIAKLHKASEGIEYFITGDKDILNRAGIINRETGIIVLSPQEATKKILTP